MEAPLTQLAQDALLDSQNQNVVVPPTWDLNAEPRHGWRERMTGRVSKIITGALGALGVGGAVVALDAVPAAAESAEVYTVSGTGDDGLWLHSDPGTGDAGDLRRVMGEGEQFTVTCYVKDTVIEGDPYWLFGTDAQNNVGYASNRFLVSNTGAGVEECGTEEVTEAVNQIVESTPAEVPVFASFDGQAAANWALARSEEKPPNAGSCTWFATNVLIAGGLQETPEWNNDWSGVNRGGLEYGTDLAWVTPDFLDYFRSRPDTEVVKLGRMSSDKNALPWVGLGDVFLYDWEGDENPDHAAVVVGFEGDYPLVAGWSENGSQPNGYKYRGWSYSEKSDQFLQLVPDEHGNLPHWKMTVTVIHVRTEEEVLEGLSY